MHGDMSVLHGPYDNDVKVWLEPCLPGDKPRADVVVPPAQPAPQPADLQPVAPVQAIAERSQPRQKSLPPAPEPEPQVAHSEPTPPPVDVSPPRDPEPIYEHVGMDQACVNWYGDGYTAQYQDPNNADSWVCMNPAGEVVGGLRVQEDFCERYYPGSVAVLVQDEQIPAYWWKCRL